MRRWLLSADDAHPVWLDVVADGANDLAISPEQLESLRKTVAMTNSMFGAVPFRHYDFLVSLTDQLPNDGGNEHQESGEISLPAGYLVDPGGAGRSEVHMKARTFRKQRWIAAVL